MDAEVIDVSAGARVVIHRCYMEGSGKHRMKRALSDFTMERPPERAWAMNERMNMPLTGTWNRSISTPIDRQSVVLELSENDGVVVWVAKPDLIQFTTR